MNHPGQVMEFLGGRKHGGEVEAVTGAEMFPDRGECFATARSQRQHQSAPVCAGRKHLPRDRVGVTGQADQHVGGQLDRVIHVAAYSAPNTGVQPSARVRGPKSCRPITDPWDLTGAYPGFSKVGQPLLWPFAQTTEGLGILVQPMVSRGAGLSAMVSMVSRGGFEASADNRVVQFANPLPAAMGIREAMRRARRHDGQAVVSSAPRQFAAGRLEAG